MAKKVVKKVQKAPESMGSKILHTLFYTKKPEPRAEEPEEKEGLGKRVLYALLYTKAPEPAPEYEAEEVEPQTKIKCPACSAVIPIYTEKRPLEITCPLCGRQGTLKGVDFAEKLPKKGEDMISALRKSGRKIVAEGADKYPRVMKHLYADEKINVFSDGGHRYLILDLEKNEVYTANREKGKYVLEAAYNTSGLETLFDTRKVDAAPMLWDSGYFHGTGPENLFYRYYPNQQDSPLYAEKQKRLEEIMQKILPEFLPPAEPESPPPAEPKAAPAEPAPAASPAAPPAAPPKEPHVR